MSIQAHVVESAKQHALAAYPRESCGLVIESRGVQEYIPCRNAADTPGQHFVLPADDYANAEDRGEVIALIHSHPDTSPEPSMADRAACEESQLLWGVVCVHGSPEAAPAVVGMGWCAPCGYEAPLLEREYLFGVLDCWTLIRDFYKREMEIELGDFPEVERVDRFWEKGLNYYMENYEAAGFERVNSKTLQRGDIICMQIRSQVWNHLGVYLGDGLMLHHPYERLSRREVYGGYWSNVTVAVLRHRLTCQAILSARSASTVS